jgi:putative oxidoreductase
MADEHAGLTETRRWLLDWSDVPLRAALAAVFIVHGSGKLFGGLEGFSGMLGGMGVPLPGVMAWVVALTEFVGGIFMALGLLVRLVALGHMAIMLVAIFTVHLSQGFKLHGILGPNGQPQAAGFEFQFALLMIALALLIRGAGPLSLDRVIRKRWSRSRH